MTSKIGQITAEFLTVRTVLQIYHWTTTSYARHEATGDFLNGFSSKMDMFIETIQGSRSERVNFGTNDSIKLVTLDDKNVVKFIENFKLWLSNGLPKLLLKNETDLLNLKDELINDINKLLYLYTFE